MRKLWIFSPLLLFLSPACGQEMTYTFYTDSNKLAWSDAQAFCRKHHTDLVTIRNKQESDFFKLFGWIGLRRENAQSPWRWSRGDKTVSFTMWFDNEPKTVGDCVSKYSTYWSSGPCDINRSFMCYEEKPLLVKENKTWEEALNLCRSWKGKETDDPASPYWPPYDLATLLTPSDHMRAQESAQQATTDEVWTGLHHLAGEWLWAGGEQMQYKDLPSCPTDGFCGALMKNGNASLKMRNCQRRRNFICYRKP